MARVPAKQGKKQAKSRTTGKKTAKVGKKAAAKQATAKKPASKKKVAQKAASKKKVAQKAASKKKVAQKAASKKKVAQKAASKKVAQKAASKKRTTLQKIAETTDVFDENGEISVEKMMVYGQELAEERDERAKRERKNVREIRPPTATRPAYPVHWGYSFYLDEALPEDSAARLREFFGRYTKLADETTSGFYVVGPDTDPEARRATWDDSGNLVEVEQLLAQLPPDEQVARMQRLRDALERPTSEGWSEIEMLLASWDPAGLDEALAEAEPQLERWPDELRTMCDGWKQRPELRRLVRVGFGDVGELLDAPHLTAIKTQNVDSLVQHHQSFAHVKSLEISGEPDLPKLVVGLTGFTGLERLILQQPTYTHGTAKSDLKALLAAPHLRGLKGLSLYGYKVTPADLEALVACEQPLVDLRIQYASMQPEAGHALARVAARKRLRSLDLKYNDLGPKGAQALFAVPDDWRSLRVLDISANEIGDRGVAALAGASLVALRWLNLSSNAAEERITAQGAKALAASPSLGELGTIILFGHPIGAEGLAALLYSPHLRGLRELSAYHPGASLAQIAAACSDEEPVPIEVLNIGSIDTSKGKLDLSRATFLRTLRMLSVDSLEGKEYAALLGCPLLGKLEGLTLGSAYADKGKAWTSLTKLSPPPNLRYLNLSGWKVTTAQAASLAASPLGQQLWGLQLLSSYIVPDAWYELYLGGVPLTDSLAYDSHAPSEHDSSTTFRDHLV